MSTPRQFFKRKNFGQFVQCTEQEYRDWETHCKADPFYATSHAEEFRINYDLDLDEFQAEGVAAPLEPSRQEFVDNLHREWMAQQKILDFRNWLLARLWDLEKEIAALRKVG